MRWALAFCFVFGGYSFANSPLTTTPQTAPLFSGDSGSPSSAPNEELSPDQLREKLDEIRFRKEAEQHSPPELSDRIQVVKPVYRARASQTMNRTYSSVIEDDSDDPWKGKPRTERYQAGLMMGLGLVDDDFGFGIIGTGAIKIVHRGFSPELNNQVFFEFAGGPLILTDNAFVYSAHLRWDFVYDSTWTLFALGGLGGAATGESNGNNFRVHPRFGLGVFRVLSNEILLRGEVSHEWVMVGVTFRFGASTPADDQW